MYKTYKKISQIEVTEINGSIIEYEHEKTGAKVIYIKTDDDNKVFMIAFKTPPIDDTGVSHIMEHSVLCGSKKYPLKDPFVELAKGSLNTFLNAMTYPDKTVYPVASRNDKDFKNLTDVYLDAVFNPLIYADEGIFKQEGWHREGDGISGVVYNEMKGALSTPEAKLENVLMRALFPDTCYKYESGGDPKSIPNLTYKMFIDFHKKHYHPSNSIIYIYGDIDIDERLEYLDREYLSKYDRIEVDTDIAVQKPFTELVKTEGTYPVSEGEDTSQKTFLSLNWLIDDDKYKDFGKKYNITDEDAAQRAFLLSLRVLLKAIVESEAAPLRKAIIEAGLGKDVDLDFELDLRQPIVGITVNGADAESADKFVEVVTSKYKELAKGLDKTQLKAALNTIEFALRESDFGATPKGLIYGLTLLRTKLYGGASDTLLRYEDALTLIKSELSNDFFESLIDTCFLSNHHIVNAILKPKVETTETAEAESLNLPSESADESAQESPSPYTDNLEVLPLLQLEDIKKETDVLPTKFRDLDGVRIVHSNIQTNGIIYLRMYLDASKVPQKLQHTAYLLVELLGRVDTKDHSYEDLANEINLNLGGLGMNLNAYAKAGKADSFMPKLLITTKVLASKQKELSTLLSEILTRSIFTDKKRIRELIEEEQIDLELSIERAAHQVVSSRLAAYQSKAGAYNNESLMPFNAYLKDLLTDFDKKFDSLADDLYEVKDRLINRNGITVGVTATDELYSEFKPHLSYLLKNLPVDEYEVARYYYPNTTHKEGITSQSMVQYVGKGANYIKLGYKYSGVMAVLETILRYEYFWKAIRVEGGAYGAFVNFYRNGNMYFESYRDPNLSRTIDVFNGTADFIKNLDLSDREMRKYIIGTISKLDHPKTPAMKGSAAIESVIREVSHEDRQRARDEILATKVEDIQKLAEIIDACMREDNICVFGNEKIVNDNAELFDKIIKSKD